MTPSVMFGMYLLLGTVWMAYIWDTKRDILDGFAEIHLKDLPKWKRFAVVAVSFIYTVIFWPYFLFNDIVRWLSKKED